MPTVVHFEIPVDKLDRAKKFYSDLFQWKIEPYSPCSDYLMIHTTGEKPVEGGMMVRKHPQQPITNYIDVTSVDEYSRKVSQLNGKIVVPKTPVPGVGYFAVCLDTENNIFGLWETDPKAGFFANAAEVATAILTSVIVSDEKYSVDELQTVWNDIEQSDFFKDQSFKELEGKILHYFNKKETPPTPFTDSEMDIILSSARQMLTTKLREEAYKLAVVIAKADKTIDGYTKDVDEKEQKLLDRIQKGLDLSPKTVEKILEDIKSKKL